MWLFRLDLSVAIVAKVNDPGEMHADVYLAGVVITSVRYNVQDWVVCVCVCVLLSIYLVFLLRFVKRRRGASVKGRRQKVVCVDG